jgi:trigger factor
MTETTCRRELDLEIPAEAVQKAVERTAKEFAKIARVPGFRPGKAPATLIRKRFAEDIKSEVLQSLLPGEIDKAVKEKNLLPITQPHIHDLDFKEEGPVKFRAVFEVLPEFDLGNYKDLDVEIETKPVTDADVDKVLEESRERAATFVAVEGRPLTSGDYAQLKLMGTPAEGGEPMQADDVMCHLGAPETLPAFTENLTGVNQGEHRAFDVTYPEKYPDAKLAGKTYSYAVEVLGVKQKKLPELNDEFAKEMSDAQTMEELRAKIRKGLEEERQRQLTAATHDALLAKLIAAHDFPVPEALVENQMDVRLDRAVRAIASQGVDPRIMKVDWKGMRERQRERAVEDVKAELLLDRIATAEKIEAADEDMDREIEAMAQRSGESAAAVRASLTKQDALDRMKSKLRSDKTLEWLHKNAKIRTRAPEPSQDSHTS